MSSLTMGFALPETMRSNIDERVKSGSYGNTSEYLRDLIRRDQEAQAAKRLRELIEEGPQSGPAAPLTDEDVAAIRVRMAIWRRRCGRLSLRVSMGCLPISRWWRWAWSGQNEVCATQVDATNS